MSFNTHSRHEALPISLCDPRPARPLPDRRRARRTAAAPACRHGADGRGALAAPGLVLALVLRFDLRARDRHRDAGLRRGVGLFRHRVPHWRRRPGEIEHAQEPKGGRLMRVVSGIQPTGNPHLGNYLGAIKRWAEMQHETECLIFLADLHAITVYNDPAQLAATIREAAATLIACGIDPEKAILFNQARVPAHAELAWLLSCTARVGWLNRMTQFKEKSGKNREGVSAGLSASPGLPPRAAHR